MPRLEELDGYQIAVEHGWSRNGAEAVETWTLVFTDPRYGHRVSIAFEKDVRDKIVERLTGVVLGTPLRV